MDAIIHCFFRFPCVHALDVSVRVGPSGVFVFNHGEGLAQVGEEGGDVGEKSRAENDVRRGESNVRIEERSEASGIGGGVWV